MLLELDIPRCRPRPPSPPRMLLELGRCAPRIICSTRADCDRDWASNPHATASHASRSSFAALESFTCLSAFECLRGASRPSRAAAAGERCFLDDKWRPRDVERFRCACRLSSRTCSMRIGAPVLWCLWGAVPIMLPIMDVEDMLGWAPMMDMEDIGAIIDMLGMDAIIGIMTGMDCMRCKYIACCCWCGCTV
jgi:hypothetical protein